MKKLNLTKQFLKKEYIKNKKSSPQIAKEMGCCHKTIYNYLIIKEIKIRTNSESAILLDRKGKNSPIFGKKNPGINKGKKNGMYGKKGKKHPTYKNGNACEAHFCLICGKIKDYRSKNCQQCFHLHDKGKNSVAYKHGKYLIQYYCIDCGKKINYQSALYGQGRCKSCARKGKHNPNFRHGQGNFPYPIKFNKELKESIRERDNNQCQICGKTERKNKQKLSVHHIDYDKDNLNPENLITLCLSCHLQANYNREIYQEYFKILK